MSQQNLPSVKNYMECEKSSPNTGVSAVAIYPVTKPTGLDVCVFKNNLLLGTSTTIDDYISKQIDEENEKNRKKDEGWTLVGEMDEKEWDERFRKKCFYENVHEILTDKSVGYRKYIENPDQLYNYIDSNIIGVIKKMGICLDYSLYRAATLKYFERKVPLAALNSQEVKDLKKVWVDIYLLNHWEDRGMCDMIQYLILPIFVEQRMAELHKLKQLYIDYRQQLYRYEYFESLDDGNLQYFHFIEPIDGWYNISNFNFNY